MICDKVKECVEKTCHVQPPVKSKKQIKKTKAHDKGKENVYQYPLGNSPCGSAECQKQCIVSLDNRSQVRCEENGKIYILDQSKKYPRFEVMDYHIDKGIVSEPEASSINKCDHLILIKDFDRFSKQEGTAILVELKGRDTRHALKQLYDTLNLQELQPVWKNQRRIFGRVICRSTPPRIRNTEEYLDVKEAFFEHHGNFKIREEKMEEEYDELGKWQ